MDCLHKPDDGSRWFRSFWDKTIQEGVPVSCSMELTACCNLDCVHCYLQPQSSRKLRRHEEMSTDRVLSLLDELADAGTLYLLLTGGEPMLREDFEIIYRYAKKSGFLVTVFSNGTMLPDNILRLFIELPPISIEVSVYGSTPETYERITRTPGAFDRCMKNIKTLAGEGQRLSLKTMVMTLNRHEHDSIRHIAEDLGLPFRFDLDLIPPYDEIFCVERYRLSPEDSVDFELSDPDRISAWRDFMYSRERPLPSEDLVRCGAGRNSIHVDPYGRLSPCVSMTQCRIPVKRGELMRTFKNDIAAIRCQKVDIAYPCNCCEARIACKSCVALSYLETGLNDGISEYVCSSAKMRYTRLLEHLTCESMIGGFHEAQVC